MRKIFFILLAGVAVLAVGCSSTPKQVRVVQDQVRAAYEMQKPLQVRTSLEDKRPEWTKVSVSEDQDSGVIYFSGGFQNGSDYAVTILCANAEALKVAVQAISQFIEAEFSSYVHGSNTGSYGVDRYVSDGLATFADALHVQGVRQKDIYYEEMFSPQIMQPTYNVWVRLEMAKVDYLQAKAEVIRKLRSKFDKAGQKAAKEKADKLLQELKE